MTASGVHTDGIHLDVNHAGDPRKSDDAVGGAGPLIVRHAGAGWYPILIAVAWFLEVWLSTRVEPAAALRGLLMTVGIAGLVTVALTAPLGRHRGALAAAILTVGMIGARDALTVIPVIATVPLLFLERRWAAVGRLALPWSRIHEALTIVAVVMLAIQVGRLLMLSTPGPKLDPSAWSSATLAVGDRPDIYVILADAHARHDVLLGTYGYDDTPVQETLTAIGFEFAASGRSNYLLTRFSLASMLTSSYLDELHDGRNAEIADSFATTTIDNNPTFPLLRRAGYEVVVISSGYEHLGLRSADRFIDTGQPNELEDALIASTAIGRTATAVDPDLVLRGIRDRTRAELETMDQLAAEPSRSQPRFVFVHLPVPHWPYVFDGSCGPTAAADASTGQSESPLRPGSAELIGLLKGQTECVDSLLARGLGDLVAKDPGAVVILMSDHGPQEYFDPLTPTAAELKERSAILFAARTPGHPHLFANDTTLVNVVPTLFNAYLGTDLPSKPNQTWFGPRASDGAFILVNADPG